MALAAQGRIAGKADIQLEPRRGPHDQPHAGSGVAANLLRGMTEWRAVRARQLLAALQRTGWHIAQQRGPVMLNLFCGGLGARYTRRRRNDGGM